MTLNFLTSFPKGPFRFVALDVETANNDRGSICQIGVACVRPDDTIDTWMTYVDPQVDCWIFTYLHGISGRTVQGAPTFAEVLPVLREALNGYTIYQHSGFDRSAVAAACRKANLAVPDWEWRDSVQVARRAWPELRGHGGHGLASLKRHLGLVFEHHDAGEDARAAAEVVLRAERAQLEKPRYSTVFAEIEARHTEDFELIADGDDSLDVTAELVIPSAASTPSQHALLPRALGTTEITQGNLKNCHIYMRNFFEAFPADAVGGSNRALAAPREITVDGGGDAAVMTDLDGTKRFFRKRGWIRTFFERNAVRAGDMILVEEIAPYSYRVIAQPRQRAIEASVSS